LNLPTFSFSLSVTLDSHFRSHPQARPALSLPFCLQLHGCLGRSRSSGRLRPLHPFANRRLRRPGEVFGFDKKARQEHECPHCEVLAVRGDHVLPDHGKTSEQLVLRTVLVRVRWSSHGVRVSDQIPPSSLAPL